MTRFSTAGSRWVRALCAACALAAAGAGRAQTPAPPADNAELFHLVKHFDFDEQKHGNYEKTPMYWKQLRGPGLPRYARGEFDAALGHDAAPSFALQLSAANVAYEYESINLTVVPYADYRIVGWIRAENAVHSRAFLTAYFVDRFGDVVPGTARVSGLVASTGAACEPWQPVSIDIAGEYPSAYALRLQVWLSQRHNWQERRPDELDPIIRRDVHAVAWFDDISIHRLPRTRLSFSRPSNLAEVGEAASLRVSLSNTTRENLVARVRVADADGRTVYEQNVAAPALQETAGVVYVPDPQVDEPVAAIAAAAPVEVALPELPVGIYDAQLSLLGGSHTLLERSLRFAILPRLPAAHGRGPELGVDLGVLPGEPPGALPQLVAALGCGAAKLAIPCPEPLAGASTPADFTHAADLVRKLAEAHVESIGVLAATPPRDNAGPAPRTREILRDETRWQERFPAMLAQLGGLLTTWQVEVDAEGDDARAWSPQTLESVRTLLKRFMSIPILIVPQGPAAPQPLAGATPSITVPDRLPPRRVPRFVQGIRDAGVERFWLALGSAARRPRSAESERIDLARSLILAAAAGPERLFVDAPLELASSGGGLHWQPTDAFIPLRTMLHLLAGQRAVASFTPAEDVLAILFDGPGGGRLAVWTWRDAPRPAPLPLHLGGDAIAYALDGRTSRRLDAKGRSLLPVGPAPLIVVDVDVPLALLAARARLEPALIELAESFPSPSLRLENPYPSLLSGEVVVRAPEGWQVVPSRTAFRATPGESLALPIQVRPPPNAVAGEYGVLVSLHLDAPTVRTVELDQIVTVGLAGIRYDASARRDGDHLLVDVTVFNDAASPVSLRLFCDVAGRPRVETVLVDIPAGGALTRTFLYRDGAGIPAQRGFIGFREIRGERLLNALVEIPD